MVVVRFDPAVAHVIFYVLRCDGCGARGTEYEVSDFGSPPAGWHEFSVKPPYGGEQQVAVCESCWQVKPCAEVFSRVRWSKLRGGIPSTL